MTNGELADVFYEVFILALKFAGPLLVVSMVVGIAISILQAATQIHEQTLTFVPKLVVIGVMLILMGDTILGGLQNFTMDIFAMIANG